MFEFFKNSKLVKIFLVIIAASFVYFGFNGLSFSQNQYIVQIGDTRIINFDVRNYLQRNRQPQTEENIKHSFLFLQKRAYLIEGGKNIGIAVSPDQINAIIKNEPYFKNYNGQFDLNKYRNFIATTYRSEALFEDSLKKDTIYNFTNYYLFNNHIISDYQLLQYLSIYETTKEIQSAEILTDSFKPQVTYTENDLKTFYEEHQNAYQQGQKIKYEFLQITPEWMMSQEKISPEEILNYYNSNKETQPKRMVSQIVFTFPKGKEIDETVKSTLRKQMENLLQEIRQHPEKFANYAQQYSQDESTAQFSGSIGLIEKNGQYFSAIEDAAFSLKTGQVYDKVVETDDGFHIIKVDASLDWKDLKQDQQGIEYVLKCNKAKDDLATLRDKLSEASFNEPKDLKKVSWLELGQDLVQQSDDWLTKQDAFLKGLPVEVINILFDPLNISEQSNSDVIIVGNQYWIVRVTDEKAARIPNFEEVKSKVAEDYVLMKANAMAVASANKILQKLNAGEEVSLKWSEPKILSLEKAQDDLSDEEYMKFLAAKPDHNHPSYYLLDKRTPPVIVKVNSEQLDYPFDKEKITLSFEKSKNMVIKKNELAILSYLVQSVKKKKGKANLER